MEEDKKNYEIALLISPKLNENELKDFLKDIEEQIKNIGLITGHKEIGKINLAYPIKKENNGYFAVFEFSAEPEKNDNFKKGLAKENNILRFLIVKKQKEKLEKRQRPAKNKEKQADEKDNQINASLEKIEQNLESNLSL